MSLDSSSLGKINRFPSPLESVEKCDACGYGTVSLMDVKGDFMVVRASAPTVPSFLAITKVSPGAIDRTRFVFLISNNKSNF